MFSAAADRLMTGQIDWGFWPKQADVIESSHPQQLYVGAFAGGKTYLGARDIIHATLENPHDAPSLVCEPTYKMCLRIAMREVQTALEQAGIRCRPVTSPTNMAIYFDRPERCIWFESGENPLNISGTTVGALWQDEPAITPEQSHKRLLTRLRDRRCNSRHLKTGTHEGLGWLHQLQQKRNSLGEPVWRTTVATLFDNGSLTQEFIDSVIADFDDAVSYRMYVLGIASALSGSVYGACVHPHHLVACDPRIGQIITSWDFNSKHMTTLCGALLPGPTVHWFDEVVSISALGTETDTQAQRVIERLSMRGVAFKRRNRETGQYEMYDNHGNKILAFMDSSGNHKVPSAPKTDEAHIVAAGFESRRLSNNPPVLDRVNNDKAWLKGNRVYFDPKHCPRLIRSYQEQPWATNSDPPAPKKKGWGPKDLQMDHFTESAGYTHSELDMLRVRGTGVRFT